MSKNLNICFEWILILYHELILKRFASSDTTWSVRGLQKNLVFLKTSKPFKKVATRMSSKSVINLKTIRRQILHCS